MHLATIPDLMPALPEIVLAVTTLILLMLGVFMRSLNIARTIAYACIILLLLAIPLMLVSTDGRVSTFGGAFVVNEFTVFVKIFVLLSAASVVLISKDYRKLQSIDFFEFPILIVFATLGMMLMVSANDFLGVYLAIELQSLSLYVIATFQKDSARSAESGLKYFVLGALSSGLMLYGISLIYGFVGSTNFNTLAEVFKVLSGELPPPGVVVGLVFIVAGFSFKISAVPFHMWTPDVYEGAPTPVTALLSAAPKIAAMGLFIRTMVGPFGELDGQWQQIIIFMSIASMGLGAFAAINQKNIKRMMAYSSIGHMGYALIGLAAVGGAENVTFRIHGIQGMLVYLVIYVFMNIGTFSCILLLKRDGRMVESIDDLAGLSKTNPGLAFIFSVFMFSMAGIPPLAGFLGKLYVFQAAINSELYTLAIIGVVTSVIGAFYYIRIVKIMYFDPPVEPLDVSISLEIKTVLTITGLAIIFLIFYPLPLISGAEQAASVLFTK
jgi:NADH-quinone oxidoreductase subunit N